MKFKTAYEKFERKYREVKGKKCMVQTHMAKETDINHIMKRYGKTRSVDPALVREGLYYGDASQFTDFQENLNNVIEGNKRFMTLPSEIRRMFDNNPQEFFSFVTNPANGEKLVELGLATKKQIDAPLEAVSEKKEQGKTPAQKRNPSKPKVERDGQAERDSSAN